ncbi:hypothetical protein HYFRA_00007734 [Hymenoscyphus fraxineus]|uniref:Uncharacterized protein n=1 Tax=Hymenoscyphus fraxineus TaxID=746836 RepID=A0A9N9PES9_9HELO|nr:hypothetical protein HYFRA_00007734 [Hymenoscyphus fraxineus]
MDAAYNQHSPYSRHNNRSYTSLSGVSLAPLTLRLPLLDPHALPESSYSYIEDRSAPTTPSVLSRSSSRVSLRKPTRISIPKSRSSVYLLPSKQARSTPTTPGGAKLRKLAFRDDSSINPFSENDRNDSDWLLRAGATMSTSARESKGQTWLVSRASSTSLTAQDEDDEEVEKKEWVRERARRSRRGSGAGAFDADDEFSPVTTRSRPLSRYSSRGNSRRGSKAHLFTPKAMIAMEKEGYFNYKDREDDDDFIAEPDFVDVEDEGIEAEEQARIDEAVVRKLARANSAGLGGWMENLLGWSLFAVEEDGEETEVETIDEKTEGSEVSSRTSRRNVDGATDDAKDHMPPLADEEAGGWQDAAWLLSVATKVLL